MNFDNVPNDVNELRKMAVNHILSSDITKFKDSIVKNLASEIPGLLIKHVNSDTNEICIERYAEHMLTQGNQGTIVELSAISELFGFNFIVIRQTSPRQFMCYTDGPVDTDDNENMRSVHLLFTGNVKSGHFRLLKPLNSVQEPDIHSGTYQLADNYTSSTVISIEPVKRSSTTLSESQQNYNQLNHLDEAIPQRNDSEQLEPEISFEVFVTFLGKCKRNIKVLKRIPRGARVTAANALSKCIDECLAQPNSDRKWMNLLSFVYGSFQVPDKSNNCSLTTLVKKNIAKPSIIFKRRAKGKTSASLSRRIELKIAEGDVKGAIKILSSNDTLAPENLHTLEQLKLKHPPPKRNLNIPEAPEVEADHLIVTEKEVVKNVNNFPNGSASGIDGISPQHLKDLTAPQTGEAGMKLIKSITKLSNFMLSGKAPNELSKIMYGATLCALTKEEGGIRPIAVGNTFRRLTAKMASASVRTDMASKFAPRQVGFGTKGGCEAAAHATRTFIKRNRNQNTIVLKIDFRNAFNELDRDQFLQQMKMNCPKIFPFLWRCYAVSTLLFYGEEIILSSNGAQQGDPCGPLVFCSAIQGVVESLISEFVVFYLDDGTIAGSYDSVLKDFETVISECGKFGLEINPSKCELYFCHEVNPEIVKRFNDISPGIIIVNELTLLGAPITENAIVTVFNKKLRQLQLLFERLTDLDNHQIAYYLLKNCLSVPKLVFLLRTSPTWNHNSLLEEMDGAIKSTLETITNSNLSHEQWILSSLPIRNGGLGVRKLQDLALPAFLSSINGLSSTISLMLTLPSLKIEEISHYVDAANAWQRLNPDTIQPEVSGLQKSWDSIQINRLLDQLTFDNAGDIARFLAIQKPESGAWLHVLPSRSIGTLLDNNSFRIMVGLRLGIDICAPHECVCGANVDSKGWHGLKCKKSAGRWSRHAELNHIIKRALATVDIPARLEPPGLFRGDGKRVDGMSLTPWCRGQILVWDSTCTDTLAPSNIRGNTRMAGSAAIEKAKRKISKYKNLIDRNFHFVPFAVETMGPWSPEAIKFFNELGKMMAQKTDEPRSKNFLKQRLSMAIQRGNAAAVMGCFQQSENLEEVFYL